MGRRDLPTGTVTFLFTDVEGSTRLLHELGDTDYARALAEHRRILRAAVADHAGIEVDTEGDAIFAAFPTALGALSAASAAQDALKAPDVGPRFAVDGSEPVGSTPEAFGEHIKREIAKYAKVTKEAGMKIE